MAFRENTTFVIGAGASAEFGLPVGSQLASAIKRTATAVRQEYPSHYFTRLIESKFYAGGERAFAMDTIDSIRDAIHTAVSIDAFIHRRRSDELIQRLGKALIAYEILEAERKSTLAPDIWENFALVPESKSTSGANEAVNPDYTWITHFFKILSDGIADPMRLGENVSIICFNYDRCIEHFLAKTIAAAYGTSEINALGVVHEKMNIIHPYGYLGPLPNQQSFIGYDAIPFGHEVDGDFDIEKVASRIKTYTEQSHDAESIDAIHNAIAHAKNIVFLGFGFNNQNLDLLRIKHRFNVGQLTRNIYATGVGLHRQIDDTLMRRVMHLFTDAPALNRSAYRFHIEYGSNCTEMMRIHDMNLSSFVQRVIEIDNEHNPPTSMVAPYRGMPV